MAAHLSTFSSREDNDWVEVWAANAEPAILNAPGFLQTAPSFDNQTVRGVIRVSGGGFAIRLSFSNVFGTTPLTLGEVDVAVMGANGTIVPGTDHALSFDDQQSATITAGGLLQSDPLAFSIAPGTTLAVSLYLPNSTGPVTWNQWGDSTEIAVGDQASASSLSGITTVQSRPILSEVDVQGGVTDGTIAVLGDSISVMDPINSQNVRWTDLLSAILLTNSATADLAIANDGIAANRLLSVGNGPSGLMRFGEDVLDAPGVREVIVEEGINDISAGASATEIEAGYLQLITESHAAGLRIVGCTITPFGNSSINTPADGAVRDEVNAWIRTSGAFDGVIDFDAAVRNTTDPEEWLPQYQRGDYIHPNAAGAQAMADAVNLAVLTGGITSTVTKSTTNATQPMSSFQSNSSCGVLFVDPDGDLEVWSVQNGAVDGAAPLGTMASGWSVAGTGNFFGTDATDLLFKGPGGAVATWRMRNDHIVSSTIVGTIKSADWSIAGTGDFYSNGGDDVLFVNAATGDVVQWQVQDGRASAVTEVGQMNAANETIAAVGNLTSGTGADSILFISGQGSVVDWNTTQGHATAVNYLGQTSAYWSIVGLGDFTGDGQNDILFRGHGGEVVIWVVEAGRVAGTQFVGFATPEWQIAGIGDYWGTGTDDILFKNAGGELVAWRVEHGQATQVATIGTTNVPTWQVTSSGSGLGVAL